MKTGRYAAILGAAVVIALGIAFLPHFYATLLAYVGLYSMVTLGLILLTGVGGLTSFGQAAFVGIGAYATAYATTALNMSPWMGLLIGLGLTVLAALVIGMVTLRLSGHYLPLSTIAWGLAVYYLIGNIETLGGHTGIPGVPPISVPGFAFDSSRKLGALIWCFVFAGVFALTNLLDSRPGRAMRALKGGALMAESVGVNTPRLKMVMFVYSALLASLSGWMYAHLLGFVNPTPFSLTAGIEYLFMAVIGGAGYVWGAVVGSGVYTFVKQWLQNFLPLIVGNSANLEKVVFGALIIVLMQVAHGGILDWLDGLRQKLRPPRPGQPPVPSDVPGHALASREKPRSSEKLLEVTKVERRFGGLVAVNKLSLEVRYGEIVGLIGPNGAGKSTLFNIISGVLSANAGEIRFRGRRIDTLPSRRIVAEGMARTFQHPILLPNMTVLENVMLGAYHRTHGGVMPASLRLNGQEEAQLRALALQQLERVGLASQAENKAGNLALGQQRMLEIARALCADPILLLLDEPAAGLRFAEKQALAALLKKLRSEGVSVLIVEHDMHFVMNLVDRIVVMNFGNLLAEGVPQQIRSNPKVLEAYLGTPE